VNICPNCGYDLKEKRPANFTPMIKRLVESRNEATQKIIKNILAIMREYHPLNSKDVYFFLDSVKGTEDKIVRYTINEYFNRGHYLKKGMPYLRAMILNFDKNKEKLRETEKRIHGTKPPYKEV
jgi:hypothetical protein